MKLLLSASTIAIALTLSAAASAKTVVLKPINQNIETQACLVAATQGISAAKELVRANNINFIEFTSTLSCNGMSLSQFARELGTQRKQTSETSTRIALVAKNSNAESQLCLDAVTMGEQKARAKHAIDTPVLCNGQNLPVFLRSFKNQDVEVRNTAE